MSASSGRYKSRRRALSPLESIRAFCDAQIMRPLWSSAGAGNKMRQRGYIRCRLGEDDMGVHDARSA